MESIGMGADFHHPTSIQTKEMQDWTLDKKWALVVGNQDMLADSGSKLQQKVEYWLTKLGTKEARTSSTFKSFRILVSGKPLDWIEQFIQSGGLVLVLDILSDTEKIRALKKGTDKESTGKDLLELQNECILSLFKLLNNRTGMNAVMSIQGAVGRIALNLDIPSPSQRAVVIQIITALTLIGNGHAQVLKGFTQYRNLKKENKRFETLVSYLSNADDQHSRLDLVKLINVLINTEDIDLRVSIRNEFIALGLEDVFKKIKEKIDEESELDLIIQIQDVYFQQKDEDERVILFKIN